MQFGGISLACWELTGAVISFFGHDADARLMSLLMLASQLEVE